MSAFVWVIIAVALGVVEIFTAGFFVVFFAVGALTTAVVAVFIPDFTIQMLVFLGDSLLMLVLGRPILKKYFHLAERPKATNVDKLHGEAVLVLEPVTRYAGRVRVLHSGEIWSAYLAPNDSAAEIAVNQEATVMGVDGAKLIIAPRVEGA